MSGSKLLHNTSKECVFIPWLIEEDSGSPPFGMTTRTLPPAGDKKTRMSLQHEQSNDMTSGWSRTLAKEQETSPTKAKYNIIYSMYESGNK